MRDPFGTTVAVVPSLDGDGRLVLLIADAAGPLPVAGVSMTRDEWSALAEDVGALWDDGGEEPCPPPSAPPSGTR